MGTLIVYVLTQLATAITKQPDHKANLKREPLYTIFKEAVILLGLQFSTTTESKIPGHLPTRVSKVTNYSPVDSKKLKPLTQSQF